MSLFGSFKRKVGAAADLRELEYVSALHQTATALRTDGTVSAEDVRLFLRSRFGLDVTEEDAIDIVKGLSGTARLPLPTVEKNEAAPSENQQTAPQQSRQKKKHALLRRKNKQEDVEEDQLAGVETQWENAQEADLRKAWEFPGRQKQARREVSTKVSKLVRFDLVDMMAMLLIPSLLRIERHRFQGTEESAEPEPSDHVSSRWGRAWRVLKSPLDAEQRRRQKQAKALKQSLQPKHDTLISDVLKILLGALDAPVQSAGTQNSFTGSGRPPPTGSPSSGRSIFPELKKTAVTKDLVRRMLEHYHQEEASQDAELIEQMVEAAGGEGSILDEHTFAQALTSDVNRWPVECEDYMSTTFYDVYGFSNVDCNKMAKILKPEDLLKPPSRKSFLSPGNVAEPALRESALYVPICSAETEALDSDPGAAFDDHQDEEMGNDKDQEQSTGPDRDQNEDTGVEVNFDYEAHLSEESSIQERPHRMGTIPTYKNTASYIDYASDAFRSTDFVVYLFAFFIAVSIYALTIIGITGVADLQCNESFGCKLGQTIYSWLIIAVILSFGGMLVIVPISFVNKSYLRSPFPPTLAMTLLVGYIAAPIVEKILIDNGTIQVSDEYKQARSERVNVVSISFYWIFGGLTLVEAVRGLGAVFVPKPLIAKFATLRHLFVPVDIRRTAVQKRAGTFKINTMIDHAYRVQRKAHKKTDKRNADNETMMCFLLYGEKEVNCGGFLWTWTRKLWKPNEGRKEGLWTHSRLFVGQLGQVMVLVAFIVFWLKGTESLATRSDQRRQEVESDGGVGSETALRYIPESWMIYSASIPGGILTLCMLVLLILIPYPNTQSIIMKYRCGVLPSLHCATFQKYRDNAGYIYYNSGNMIYAAIGAGLAFFVLFAGFLFLLFWPPTSDFMLILLAWGIGLGVTVCLKMLLIMCCGRNYWKAMYRRRPFAANYSSLGYECWNIGLGGGVMISRLCQFLLAAAFWVGRIDSAFLSDDVCVLGYRFDYVPGFFVSEVLIHEAHRHPFMERLAGMYLMRLKHGEYFGSDAGAQWRNLFVLALMPWMMKYCTARNVGNFDDEDSEGDEEQPALDGDFPAAQNNGMEAEEIAGSGDSPSWDDSSSVDSDDVVDSSLLDEVSSWNDGLVTRFSF